MVLQYQNKFGYWYYNTIYLYLMVQLYHSNGRYEIIKKGTQKNEHC